MLMGILAARAQETPIPARWHVGASFGSYAASIAVPRFDPFHPRLQIEARYQWNNDAHSQWVQSANLGYFFHKYVQHGVQLYTEFGWQRQWDNGLRILPLAIGGGYVLSFQDMPTHEFNPDTEQYERVGVPLRNNWLISLGSTIGYRTPAQVLGRSLSFYLSYRLHVQGTFIKSTVPVVAYSPLMLGLEIPLSQN